MIRSLVKYTFILLCIFVNNIAFAKPDGDCNPVVSSMPKISTTSQALSALATKYNFSLTFPKLLDRPVDIDDEMKLSQLIKFLTLDMNTVLRHEKVKGCIEPKLTELIVMTVGEESEYVIVETKPDITSYKDTAPTIKSRTIKPFEIYDMEQYVTEVLLRQRKSNMRNMTVDQKKEFNEMKEILRVELKDEISEIRKSRKHNKKKQKI